MKDLTQYINESLKDWNRNDWLRLKDMYDTNHTDELADFVDKYADKWSFWNDQQTYFAAWYMIKYENAELKKSKDGINTAPFTFDGAQASDKKTGKSIKGAVGDGKLSWKEVADIIKEFYK